MLVVDVDVIEEVGGGGGGGADVVEEEGVVDVCTVGALVE